MFTFLKKNFYPILIFIIVAVLAWLNYTPGTFLTGWDTLHPEFDFGLNFNRLINGVWRSEQGFGAIAGHSHMSELPRVAILWLLHFVFPLSALRYLYIFLMLLLGPLGIFYLIRYTFKNYRNSELVAFLTSAFYIFNLSTLQQFFVPFEMFPTQYAYLPWILLFSLKFLQEGGKKNLIWFALTILFSTPQAYAAQLWYAFFGTYFLFLVVYSLLFKRHPGFISGSDQIPKQVRNDSGKRSIVLLGLTLLINSFWLIPNLYYLPTSSDIPIEAKQNRIFTQEYRLRNRENGYLKDVAIAKGFYIDWPIDDLQTDVPVYMMEVWRNYLKNPWILALGYLYFAGVVAGLFFSFKKKDKLFLAFLPFFIVPFVLLMNSTPPFSWFFDFLSRFVLFEEALRFVFSKFSILLIFSYALFFSLALRYFLAILNKRNLQLFTFVLLGSLFIYSWPMFQGQLITDKLRVNIPQNYFDFWSHMKAKDSGEVLSLPLHNFAGWTYYDWGYQGAGFVWFGLKQPLLDRDSDRWSVANEQAYREISYSVYARNPDLFIAALHKYNFKYLIWDKDVITAGVKNRPQILFARETQELLDELVKKEEIKKDSTFGNLDVYNIATTKPKVEVKKISNSVEPIYHWSNYDFAYLQKGDYLTQEKNDIYYPFRDILTKDDRVKKDVFQYDEHENSYVLATEKASSYRSVFVPDYLTTENTIFGNIYLQKTGGSYALTLNPLLPESFASPTKVQISLAPSAESLTLNGTELKYVPSFIGSNPVYIGQGFIYTKQPNFIDGQEVNFAVESPTQPPSPLIFSKLPFQKIGYNAEAIYQSNNGRPFTKIVKENNTTLINLSTKNAQTGVYLPLENIPHNTGYILIVKSRNNTGMPVRICVKNLYSNLCGLYDELSKNKQLDDDIFLLPPLDDGIGYGISFDNISYGQYASSTDIESVQLIPFPYNFLSQIYFYNQDSTPTNTVILRQSYHPAWRAYLNGKKLKEHVLVDNWANGWVVPEGTNVNNVTFVFWPQYLEYVGFALAFLAFIYVFRYNEK